MEFGKAQSYLVTLNSWCYGCMSNNDGQKLQTYYIQNEALRKIIQCDQIILCCLCQRVAQKTEQFIYNVQHSQVWLETKKEFSDEEIESTKANIRPLVNLTFSLPSQDDMISLSGTDEEEFRVKEVKLEFHDDIQNTTISKQEHEDGGRDFAEATEQGTDYITESQEVQKQAHEDVAETIEEHRYQDLAETTEQETHNITESEEVHSNNLDIFDDRLSENSLSDVNGHESEKEENCIENKTLKPGKKIERILLTKEQFREEMIENAKNEHYLAAQFKCADCVKHFRMKDTYERHTELHKKISGAYECDLCNRWIATSDQLVDHLNRHLSRFKCSKCGLVGRLSTNMKEHYRIVHEGRNDNICDICGKLFSSKPSLRAHKRRMHSDHTPATCSYCGKTFKNKYSLPVHLITVHNDEVAGRLNTCEVCGCSFVYKKSLTQHMQTHSETNDYYCVECDKKFISEYSLKTHLKTAAAHVDVTELSLACSQCGRRFYTKRSLQAHINGHNGVLSFQCAHCDKAYPLKATLAKHILIVHEKYTLPRKFPCRVCDKAFKSTALLELHIRTHTGEKPFKCSKCSAEFSQSGSLHNHNKFVHLGLKRERTAKGGKRLNRKKVRKSKTPTPAESSDLVTDV